MIKYKQFVLSSLLLIILIDMSTRALIAPIAYAD